VLLPDDSSLRITPCHLLHNLDWSVFSFTGRGNIYIDEEPMLQLFPRGAFWCFDLATFDVTIRATEELPHHREKGGDDSYNDHDDVWFDSRQQEAPNNLDEKDHHDLSSSSSTVTPTSPDNVLVKLNVSEIVHLVKGILVMKRAFLCKH